MIAAISIWLVPSATITAALVAGAFAIINSRKSQRFQRELEKEKLINVRKDAELAKVKADKSEYLQSQALPFLKALDKALNESYKTIQFQPYFVDLGGYIPQIRDYAHKGQSEWMKAMEQMSQYRMQLLLFIKRNTTQTIITLLSSLTKSMTEILNIRNKIWFNQANEQELWEAQNKFIKIGYQLMIEIKDAAMNFEDGGEELTQEAKVKLVEELSLPFEEASIVSLPYGSSGDFSWIGIWESDLRPETLKFVEDMTHDSYSTFKEALANLTHEIYNHANCIDIYSIGRDYKELEVHCISAKLSSEENLRNFINVVIPKLRTQYKVLWSSFRYPQEYNSIS